MIRTTQIYFYSVLDVDLSSLYNTCNFCLNPEIMLIFYIMKLMFRELVQNLV